MQVMVDLGSDINVDLLKQIGDHVLRSLRSDVWAMESTDSPIFFIEQIEGLFKRHVIYKDGLNLTVDFDHLEESAGRRDDVRLFYTVNGASARYGAVSKCFGFTAGEILTEGIPAHELGGIEFEDDVLSMLHLGYVYECISYRRFVEAILEPLRSGSISTEGILRMMACAIFGATRIAIPENINVLSENRDNGVIDGVTIVDRYQNMVVHAVAVALQMVVFEIGDDGHSLSVATNCHFRPRYDYDSIDPKTYSEIMGETDSDIILTFSGIGVLYAKHMRLNTDLLRCIAINGFGDIGGSEFITLCRSIAESVDDDMIMVFDDIVGAMKRVIMPNDGQNPEDNADLENDEEEDDSDVDAEKTDEPVTMEDAMRFAIEGDESDEDNSDDETPEPPDANGEVPDWDELQARDQFASNRTYGMTDAEYAEQQANGAQETDDHVEEAPVSKTDTEESEHDAEDDGFEFANVERKDPETVESPTEDEGRSNSPADIINNIEGPRYLMMKVVERTLEMREHNYDREDVRNTISLEYGAGVVRTAWYNTIMDRMFGPEE